jgi:type IV secretion system protein VirB9
VVASTPVPNPPERKPAAPSRSTSADSLDPTVRVARANAAARVEPSRTAYANASQIYAFADGALFQVYAAPGQITDIALQEGERLSGTGPVAAGDTTRWVIGDTESGAGEGRRVHILVKPTRANLQTNLVVNTDRRTYHIELRATPSTYMASVGWTYPDDERRAAEAAAAAEQEATPAIAIENLNFAYRIDGAKPAWRPVRVFDDGRQTFIEFPAGIGQSEMPPLFVGAGRGRDGELVNYRVAGQRMVIDRLFDTAELRLGDRRGQQKVRIERTVRP